MSLETDATWIKSHLITTALILLTAFGSVYGVESLIAKHDAQTESKYSQILTQQTAQTAQDEAALRAVITSAQAAIAQQQQQITNDQKTIASIKATVVTIPAPQVAQELGGTSPDPNTVVLPLDKAQTALAAIEELVPLQDQLSAETKIATDESTVVAQQTKDISDLKTELTDTQNKDNAALTSCKADARKGKLKWFGIGYIAGFVTGHVY